MAQGMDYPQTSQAFPELEVELLPWGPQVLSGRAGSGLLSGRKGKGGWMLVALFSEMVSEKGNRRAWGPGGMSWEKVCALLCRLPCLFLCLPNPFVLYPGPCPHPLLLVTLGFPPPSSQKTPLSVLTNLGILLMSVAYHFYTIYFFPS